MTQFRTLLNFRDLGGYPTQDNKTIKPGFFYRSGGLYQLNEEEKEEFVKLNIKTIVELRTLSECVEKPDPIFEGIEYLTNSGREFKYGDNIDFSPSGMMQMDEAADIQYAKLLKYDSYLPFENDAMHNLFTAIREEKLPILFHCFSGKDRTGAAAMLVLALLNVDKETIVADFMLSNEYCKADLDKYLSECPIDLEKHPETKRLVIMTWGVDESIIQAEYQAVLDKYGTFEEYFIQEHGYTMEDIERIRETYTY